MKSVLKILAVSVLAAFIIIQFFRPDFRNPAVNKTEIFEASTEVPANIREILKHSCYDCHSNETIYPWYSKIQPSAWFLSDHIAEGRRKLNFSVWNTYETRRKRRKLDEICEQVKSRAMPLPSYLWIHRNARLSDEEIKILCEWTSRESERLAKSP